MNRIESVIARMDSLAVTRASLEAVWRKIAIYALPNHARFNMGSSAPTYDRWGAPPTSIEAGRQRYDDTAVKAVDRLGAGMESMATPSGAKWHSLAPVSLIETELGSEQRAYYEKVRDALFAMRYHARSGFVGAHQRAIRSAIGLGVGIVYIEEGRDHLSYEAPARYTYLPLSECYLATNAQGIPDTLYRRFKMTARQMVQKFGKDRVHGRVLDAYNNPSKKDETFDIIHAVEPREDGRDDGTNRQSRWASYYIDRTNPTLLRESGYFEFPLVVYYWEQPDETGYAQSPVMMCFSEIVGLNAMVRASNKGFLNYADPPILARNESMRNKPNFNPGKINYGWLDAEGRQQAQFMANGARPDFVSEILRLSRENVQDALYINLFQSLLQSPDMTATQSLIRQNEKRELVGPAAEKIQWAMAHETEVLLGILIRQGAFRPGAVFEPPEDLQGRSFGARFVSPMEQARKSAEGIGTERVIATALQFAQFDDGESLVKIDADAAFDVLGDAHGAPAKIFRSKDDIAAIREQRAQKQNAAQALEMAKTGGQAAKDIVPALQGIQDLAAGGVAQR